MVREDRLRISFPVPLTSGFSLLQKWTPKAAPLHTRQLSYIPCSRGSQKLSLALSFRCEVKVRAQEPGCTSHPNSHGRNQHLSSKPASHFSTQREVLPFFPLVFPDPFSYSHPQVSAPGLLFSDSTKAEPWNNGSYAQVGRGALLVMVLGSTFDSGWRHQVLKIVEQKVSEDMTKQTNKTNKISAITQLQPLPTAVVMLSLQEVPRASSPEDRALVGQRP